MSEHECDAGEFDRTVCVCGAMHSFCTVCGQRQDPCPEDESMHDDAPADPVEVVAVALASWWGRLTEDSPPTAAEFDQAQAIVNALRDTGLLAPTE